MDRRKRFGKLKVIKEVGKNKRYEKLWLCECKCGNEAIVKSYNLTSGKTKSCGCIRTGPKIENLIGRKFNRLIVISKANRDKNRTSMWKCKCECGNITIVRRTSLLNGTQKSCGCLRKERMRVLGLLSKGRSRKYSIDERYFENIDNEHKAYWLGFLMADGNVYKNSVRVGLSIVDYDHLVKLKKSLNATYLVTKYKSNNKYEMCNLYVTSKDMVSDLSKLGCVPNKTFKIETPKLSSELMRHFYRGYIDGDGCLASYNRSGRNRQLVSLVGRKKFLEDFKIWLQEELDMHIKSNILKCNHSKVFKFATENRNLVKQIVELLYDQSNIYLDRKYYKYMRIINNEFDRN